MEYTWKRLVTETVITRSEKVVEVRPPKPGLRHNAETIYVTHRFPIKGGIDRAEHIYRVISEKNALLFHLMSAGKISS